MAKIKGKGTVVQHTISASLTAIAQVLSVEHSGSGSETYKSTSLDSTVFHTYDQTGFSEGGQVTLELFYDPSLVGHQFITDLIAAPADNAMKIIYADTAEQSFTAASVQFSATVVMDDGVKGTAVYQVDGDPGWKT